MKETTITIRVRKSARFFGVNAAARALKVTPQHLTECLHGRRAWSKKMNERIVLQEVPEAVHA